ncbi:MAG TPA: hypothetical protein VGL23_01265, partial [Chloroflexota bacterium]
MAQGRRRSPPARPRRPPPGRRRPPERQEYEDEELEEEDEPPLWERLILSKAFRLLVGATFAAAAIAVLAFLVGPANISRAVGYGGAVVGRQSGRLGGLAAGTVAVMIQDEGRRLWVETATPLASALATPPPTATPFPTPPPPRRPIELAPTPPSKPLQPGQPQSKPPPPQLPYEAAQSSMVEYFKIVSDGDVRRALQYWAPEAAPEARSALDAAVARGEKYTVRAINLR